LNETDDEMFQFALNESGTKLYYFYGYRGYSVYEASITEEGVGEYVHLEGVGMESFMSYDGDSLIYTTEGGSGKAGDLYVNDHLLDTNVAHHKIRIEDSGILAYCADWDAERTYGTLKIYDGAETRSIAKGVYDYLIITEGEIVYLVNYDPEVLKGDLYLYDGHTGEKERIDEDVSRIMPIKRNAYAYSDDFR
jgi:hypothetical protein